MKRILIAFAVLCCVAAVSHAQNVAPVVSRFVLSAENIPVFDMWSSDSGSGSGNVLWSISPTIYDQFDSVREVGDTSLFSHRPGGPTLIVAFDNRTTTFRSISYSYAATPGPYVNYSFKIENAKAIDQDTAFVIDLTGPQLSESFLSLSGIVSWSSTPEHTYRSDDLAPTGKIDPTTHIHIQITKSHLASVQQPVAAARALQVFPNPSVGEVNIISSADAASMCTVFDALGREVARVSLVGSAHLDLSSLPSGIYRVHTGDDAAQLIIRH